MVAWVWAPHQSSGTGGTTCAASSFFTSRLPTCGPLPWVRTTSTPAATRSATRCIATPIGAVLVLRGGAPVRPGHGVAAESDENPHAATLVRRSPPARNPNHQHPAG